MTGQAIPYAQPGQRPFAIEMRKVNKWFAMFHVLRNINLSVQVGERIVICGPSGLGKSTMSFVASTILKNDQAGEIIVNGVTLTDDVRKIDEVRSDIGMVFQHFNLFPHLTVLENCALAPFWVRKTPRKKAEEVAIHYLNRVKIADKANSYPGQIIGGSAAARRNSKSSVYEPKDYALR